MSGEVQTRKRRDKKRKKDDTDEAVPSQIFAKVPTPPTPNDDIDIHVHKESSTGGGICAKIVFFFLLAILAVLIGLIITEHRGLTDLDTIQSEPTKFSQIFEGWVDTADKHEDAHAVESHEHESGEADDGGHDEEHDDEHDDAHDDEHDEDEPDSEHDDEHEEEEAEEEDETEDVSKEAEVSDEKYTQEETEEEKEATEEEEEEEDHEEEEEEEETAASKSEEANVSENIDEDQQSEAAEDGDEDDDDTVDIPDDKSAEENDIAEDELCEGDNCDDEAEDQSQENEDAEGEAGEAEGEEENNETNVVLRVGVGVTILVVAHVVLIKKWKPDKTRENKSDISHDLSRRNTIVVPPRVEEVHQIIDNDDEEYSEEETSEIVLQPQMQKDYKQLRTTYERSLTPDSEEEKLSDEYEEDDEEDIEYDDENYKEDDEVVEEEEEEEDEEQVSDIDDEELMKKLEAKYGKLPIGEEELEVKEDEEDVDESEEEEEDDEDDGYDWKRVKGDGFNSIDEDAVETSPQSDPYLYKNFTNDDDYLIHDQLDEAYQLVDHNDVLAITLFNNILKFHPKSPRALYGKAKALDNLAEMKRSNKLLDNAINLYMDILALDNVPTELFITVGEHSINRLRFMGNYNKAITVHKILIEKFPDNAHFRNQLAVTYLTTNKISFARKVLLEVLSKWPGDGFAMVHYGFILKVNDGNLVQAAKYLKKGLATKDEGVVDGRFYFHLGDTLLRMGKSEEADEVHAEAVQNNVFLSKHQRSLYNVKGLTGKPWWEKEDTPQYLGFYNLLENNYKQIKDEGLALLNQKGFFQDESENLRNYGQWKQFELYARGIKNVKNCKACPGTCKVVEKLSDAVGCRRGQIKFSIMHPNTHVWPHCGPTNCRLRIHLGLKVPSKTFIRVGNETKSWQEGKILIFDDSFEHEVWHNGSDIRLVLIVDVWHPELSVSEKQSLSAI